MHLEVGTPNSKTVIYVENLRISENPKKTIFLKKNHKTQYVYNSYKKV